MSAIEPETAREKARVERKQWDAENHGPIPSFCKKCGRDVRDFVAPDDVWSQIETDIVHGSTLCYGCFSEACEERGLPTVWRLTELEA